MCYPGYSPDILRDGATSFSPNDTKQQRIPWLSPAMGSFTDAQDDIIRCPLKPYHLRLMGEAAEGGGGVLEIENLGIAVILVIHTAKVRIGFQHGGPGFPAVVPCLHNSTPIDE